MGALMHAATGGSWPKERSCLVKPGTKLRCTLGFTPKQADGLGSQILARMEHWHDAVTLGCTFMPSSLAVKQKASHQFHRKLAHGVSPHAVDRAFGLTEHPAELVQCQSRRMD